jgi:hypothetical protein
MRRRTKIIWGSIVGAAALAVGVFWSRSDLVRRSDATLETVLANARQSTGAPGDPVAPGARSAPSAEQVWVVKSIRDATGRRFDIEGEFDAWLLPLPGMLVGRASLSNAEGFGDTPFAVIDGMEVRVGSLSPFERRVVVERAALAGLRLNLARNAAGQDNWSDMERTPVAATPTASADAGGAANAGEPADASSQANPTTPSAGSSDWTTSVQAIEITDAEINWNDAATGRYWRLSTFELLASGLDPGAEFPLAFSFAFERDAMAIAIDSEMRATTTDTGLSLRDLSFDFDDIDAGDLSSLFASAVVTGDPELRARAVASRSLEFEGSGSFDGVTGKLDFSGDVRLADGTVLPVTIGGTFAAPGIWLGP